MHELQNETDLLQKAIDACLRVTGLHFTIDQIQTAGSPDEKIGDAILRLHAKGAKQQFFAEVKRGLTNAALGAVVRKLAGLGTNRLLVTEYVNPNMADRLRRLNVPFIDTAGNVYINYPPFFAYVRGQAQPKLDGRRRTTRAFQPTGLKVLFAFLSRPDLVDANYRDIAKVAGVALGTVGWVVTDLKELGFWFDMGKRGRTLTRKAKLLERWVVAYPEQLRRRLTIGRFTAPDKAWWRDYHLDNFNAFWGGEIAAAKLTHYVRPEFVTLYVRDKLEHLVIRNRLKRDTRGEVEILKAFWRPECDWKTGEVAHPLLVYADLLTAGTERNIEAAGLIYEQYLAGLVRED